MEIFPKPPFMKQIFHLKVTVILLLFTGSLFCEILKVPSLFKEWIATERLITKESSSWEIEKNLLNDLFELLEEEKQTIDEKLQSVEKENSAGEEERIKLADQNEDLKSGILPVPETLERLENQLLRLAPRFPPPLQDDLQSFLNRIPKKNKKDTITASVSQRLQDVVGALQKLTNLTAQSLLMKNY